MNLPSWHDVYACLEHRGGPCLGRRPVVHCIGSLIHKKVVLTQSGQQGSYLGVTHKNFKECKTLIIPLVGFLEGASPRGRLELDLMMVLR